jgi:WhiB family redox-sensing transcriptional regulator
VIEDWPSLASCRGGGPEAMFVQGTGQEVAKQVCRGCPVRYECLADALDNQIAFGVWGGLTERERRVLRRRHPGVTSWRRVFGEALGRAAVATHTGTVEDTERAFTSIRASMAAGEYAECYAREYPQLVRFVMKHGVTEQEAFDAAQQAFVAAYRVWEQIHSPRAWLRRVAIRSLRPRPESRLPAGYDPPAPGPSQLQLSDETRAVLDALGRLPDQQRRVMAWTYDGFTPTEIAAELAMTPEAVRQALLRARQTLKRELLDPERRQP